MAMDSSDKSAALFVATGVILVGTLWWLIDEPPRNYLLFCVGSLMVGGLLGLLIWGVTVPVFGWIIELRQSSHSTVSAITRIIFAIAATGLIMVGLVYSTRNNKYFNYDAILGILFYLSVLFISLGLIDNQPNYSVINTLFSFRGRICRTVFWSWLVFSSAVSYGIAYIVSIAYSMNELDLLTVQFIEFIVLFVIFVSSMAIMVKRWHDIDRSGAWVLFNFIPIAGWAIVIVFNGFIPGTNGPNRFGPATA